VWNIYFLIKSQTALVLENILFVSSPSMFQDKSRIRFASLSTCEPPATASVGLDVFDPFSPSLPGLKVNDTTLTGPAAAFAPPESAGFLKETWKHSC
jgi:hypothetical protein